MTAMLVSIGAFADLSPETIPGATTIDGNQAKAMFDQGVLFVDPRKDADWEAGRIPGAVHLELNKQLSEKALLEEASKDDAIVFYCNGIKCMVSTHATEQAVAWGFKKVNYYRAGFPDWKSHGYPVE
ncbi:MAG: rhodanese-like domain-containing protein [Gammaproteobacteria bacterium]|nr:rhodanese-like domain-containing protein [Gammaproteobacteria bacterium]